MKNAVIIKGNKYGISILLDKDMEFDKLMDLLKERLSNAEGFFDSDRQLAVTFEGRQLSNDEMDKVLTVIADNSKLNIQYVIEENSELETTFYDVIKTEKGDFDNKNDKDEDEGKEKDEPVAKTEPSDKSDSKPVSSENKDGNGMFYKGILRSGQSLEAKESLVIIGDVNPGSKVVAGGNIVIIGALKGSVTAGANGNRNAFVMAMSMEPMQIQIANVIAKNADVKHKNILKKEAMIATIVNDHIRLETISKSAIQEIMEDKL